MNRQRALAAEPTLAEVLVDLGFTYRKTTRRDPIGTAKDILQSGVVVFTGTAGDVWAWLRREGLIK